MPPSTSRDFQKVAAQRFFVAQFLYEHRFNVDAMYLSGYVVECSLKALILELSPEAERANALLRITSGAKMHNFEVLAGELSRFNCALPTEIAKRFRRWKWSVNLRYETGHGNSSETLGFLRTAQAVYDWVERLLP
jgi:HEPN domain-containing protein